MELVGVSLGMEGLTVESGLALMTAVTLDGVIMELVFVIQNSWVKIVRLMRRHVCLSNVHLIVFTIVWENVHSFTMPEAWGHRDSVIWGVQENVSLNALVRVLLKRTELCLSVL
jgi:hypothetical protein